jgi:hypothetical protein
MLKLNSLALWLLTVMAVAPSSLAAIRQNHSTRQRIDGDFHVQKLQRIRKPFVFETPVIKTRKPVPKEITPSVVTSPSYEQIERQKERDHRERFGPSERPDHGPFGPNGSVLNGHNGPSGSHPAIPGR